MNEITLKEHLKKASKAQKDKYSLRDFKRWGTMSAEKRLGNMTTEEKSEYFKKIRKGTKISS